MNKPNNNNSNNNHIMRRNTEFENHENLCVALFKYVLKTDGFAC